MNPKKVLVVYYSRSGNTQKVATAIAHSHKCELEELQIAAPPARLSGYLRALSQALRKKQAPIGARAHEPSAYRLVIIGTPVWAASVSSPVRAFLKAFGPKLPDVAFFCTLGGRGAGRTFRQMRALCGKPPVTVCAIAEPDIASEHFRSSVADFTKELRSYSRPPQHHEAIEITAVQAG